MSLAILHTRALLGVDAVAVRVETHLSSGLPAFAIVGLPETAVKESKERVRSALINSGFEFPPRRITVNLAPAELPKSGGRFDLAIALGILVASGQLDAELVAEAELLGELALDGRIRQISGAIPALIAARKRDRPIVLPDANQAEVNLIAYGRSHTVTNLAACVEFLRQGKIHEENNPQPPVTHPDQAPVFPRIIGQLAAKHALLIAAAGRHNLLMMGPPGSGKTLLANALVALLPPLSVDEACEVAAIHSIASTRMPTLKDWRRRPLRHPHHSASTVSLTGGGNRINPGEISLAHRGLLFLDEFSEFKPGVLDAMREPLETGSITVSRANYRCELPANFQLVAAMNPCPCGYAGDSDNDCRCSHERIRTYLGKISGPLLDRLDLIFEVPALNHAELLLTQEDSFSWSEARTRVEKCQQLQMERAGKLNSELSSKELEQYCPMSQQLKKSLSQTLSGLKLSARGVHRVIRVARTVADLDCRSAITEGDLLRAVELRSNRLFGRLFD